MTDDFTAIFTDIHCSFCTDNCKPFRLEKNTKYFKSKILLQSTSILKFIYNEQTVRT